MIVQGELILVLHRQRTDIRCHPEVADRHHVVQLAEDTNVFRANADLLVRLPQSRRLQAVVGVITRTARKRYLPLVMLYMVGAFGEDDVVFALTIVEEDKDRRGGPCGVVYMARIVVG